MTQLLAGGCLCGGVHYETLAEPIFSGNCHCRDCQKTSGSGYTPAIFVPEAEVVITGALTYYDHTADSGNKISRGFCPICGSQLFAKLELLPGIIGLRAGTLNEPQHFQPKIDIYTASANHWDVMNPTLPKFLKSPQA